MGYGESLGGLLMNNISLRKVKYIACKQKVNLKYLYFLLKLLIKDEERQRNSSPFGSGRAPKCDIRKATRRKGRNALSHVHRGDFFVYICLYLQLLVQVSMTNNRYALEMQEVKDLLKDEVKPYSQHLVYVYMFI